MRAISGYFLPPVAVLLAGAVFTGTAIGAWAAPRPALVGAASSLEPGADQQAEGVGSIAVFFRPEVQYWRKALVRWAAAAGVDPNLAAVVMQIESCGNPVARSRSGALGLFQVMPFHFRPDEEPLEPETNATRGLNYLSRSWAAAGEAGRALAGYNGGIASPPAGGLARARRYVSSAACAGGQGGGRAAPPSKSGTRYGVGSAGRQREINLPVTSLGVRDLPASC
jgi:soluble lytic murein transglycosylase-like protein